MRLGWRGAVGILLSAGLLAWTLKDVEAARVLDVLARSNIPLLALSSIIATGIFPLRALRWRYILAPIATDLPYGALWRSTAVGMMVSNIVPARLGEVARAFALGRETRGRVPFASAFASVAVDRVFDALIVFLLMLLAMLDPRFPGGTVIAGRAVASWAATLTVVLGAVLASLYLVVRFPAQIITLFELVARRVSPTLERRGREALVSLTAGLGVLRSPRNFAMVVTWTLVHWLTNAFAFWIAFHAVGVEAPFSAALFLQGVIAISVSLPSSPGFFGFFEAAARIGLAVYGVGTTQAVSWAIGFHLLSFIPITVMGSVYFARLGLSLDEMRAGASAQGDEASTPAA